jgi:hypothetical protein
MINDIYEFKEYNVGVSDGIAFTKISLDNFIFLGFSQVMFQVIQYLTFKEVMVFTNKSQNDFSIHIFTE